MSSRVSALGLALLVGALLAPVAYAASSPVILSGDTANVPAGQPFTYTITATNGPIYFSAQPLPAGLSINTQTGVISGTTTNVGIFAITLTASNQPPGQQNTTNTGSKVLTLSVLAVAPNITNALEIRGSLGLPLNFTLTATGFPAPTFKISALPPGLILSGSVISGTPLQGGVLSAQITATNAGPNASGGIDTKQILLNITAPSVITSDLIIPGTKGQPISYRIFATNNPISYNLVDLTVPPISNTTTAGIAGGITINASGTQTGVLSGTPTSSGQFPAVLKVSNTLNLITDPCAFNIPGGTSTAQVIFAISDVLGSPAITSSIKDIATVATPYSYGITATFAPTSYSVTGTLPPGLSLNTATGVISGVPTLAAASGAENTTTPYTVTITATNAIGSGSVNLTIIVGHALPTFDLPTVSLTARMYQPFQLQVTAKSFPPESGIPAPTYEITDQNGVPADPLAGGYPAPPGGVPSAASNNIVINPLTGLISGSPDDTAFPTTEAGNYTVFVRAHIATQGYVYGTFQLLITKSAAAPATGSGITSALRDFVIEGCPYKIQVVCPGAGLFTLTNPNPALNLAIDPTGGLLSGTPTDPTGSNAGTLYNVPIVCYDNATDLNVVGSGTLRLTVFNPSSAANTNAPLPPFINVDNANPLLSKGGTIGELFTYPIITSPDYTSGSTRQTPLIYSGAPLPIGTTLISTAGISNAFDAGDPQVGVSGIPTEIGTKSATVSVTNAAGSDSKNIALTIAPVTIYSVLAASGQVGKDFLVFIFPPNFPAGPANAPYFIRATGGANKFLATSLPPGLRINPQTGAISGTPAASGTFNVIISATNTDFQFLSDGSVSLADGTADTKTLVVTIAPPPGTAPTISNAPLTATVIDSIPTNPIFDVSTTGGSSPANITFTALGLPQGLVIDPLTGIISGTTSQLGTYSVTLVAADNKGTALVTTDDEFDAKILTLTVTQTPPIIDSTTLTYSRPINVSFNYPIVSTGSQPQTYTATIVNSAPPALPAGLTLSGANIVGTPSQEGTYNITLTATNQALPVGSDSKTLVLTLTRPPTFTSALTATGTVGVPFAYAPTVTAFPPAIITIDATDVATLANFGLTFDGSSITGTPTKSGAVGTITFTATSSDYQGPTVATQTLQIQIDNVKINPPLIASGVAGQPFSFAISATGNSNIFTATNLPAGLSIDGTTGIISGTPLTAGQSVVPISASNGVGTANATLIIAISTGPGIPAITSSLNDNTVLGVGYIYQIAATNTPTSFGATNLPPGLAISTTTGIISGVPTTDGLFSITISATNGNGTGSDTLMLAVAKQANGPAITSPLTATAIQGSPFTYQIKSLGTNLSYSATFPGTLVGLTFNATTGIISGTPLTAGVFNVALQVNSTGFSSVSATLVLTVVSQSPHITSSQTKGSPVGNPFAYVITATGSTPITYGISGSLPPGLTFDPTTAAITGTPTVEGTTVVTMTASNAFPPPDSKTLTITIGPIKPTITSALTASGSTNAVFNYQITAVGSAPITFGAISLPPGLNLDSTTGIISGTPTTVGNFNTTITATNNIGSDSKILAIKITEALDDFDQDGFPNELEIALGTDPFDPNSTPFNGAAAGARGVLSLTRVTIKLNFAPTAVGKDSITETGTVPLPAGYIPGGKTCTIVVGGFKTDFGTLVLKTSSGVFGKSKVSIKPSKNNAPAKYSLTLKGSFAASLADEGLINATIDKKANSIHTVRTFLLLDAAGPSPLIFEGAKQVLYVSKIGKTGTATGK